MHLNEFSVERTLVLALFEVCSNHEASVPQGATGMRRFAATPTASIGREATKLSVERVRSTWSLLHFG